jgi:hypothetical protein
VVGGGGDLLIGVANDGSVVGIERDQLETEDTFNAREYIRTRFAAQT